MKGYLLIKSRNNQTSRKLVPTWYDENNKIQVCYFSRMKWINEVPSTSSQGCIRTFMVHPNSMLSQLATARNTSARNVQCPASSRTRSRSRMIYGVPSFAETIAWFNKNSKYCAIVNNLMNMTHFLLIYFFIIFYTKSKHYLKYWNLKKIDFSLKKNYMSKNYAFFLIITW